MWPAFIPKIVKDKPAKALDTYEKVPDNLDDMLAWAHVRHFPTKPQAPYLLLYTDLGVGNVKEVHEVSFRLQGYVVELNLDPLGDWNK